MSKSYALAAPKLYQAVKRGVARYGIKGGLMIAGGIVAAGTMGHPASNLPQPPLIQRVVAVAPAVSRPLSPPAEPAGPALNIAMQHASIDHWVTRLSSSSSGFGQALGRMAQYADMIKAKLDAKNMPADLIYLAAIESEFNPNARSHAAAVGLWQFMRGTARSFGLKVGHGLDERKDPARETDAALSYLSSLHGRLGSWYLAAAAFNSGAGTVLRALRRTTGKTSGTDEDFFRILPALPRETQSYVPKLIAAARVGNAPEQYGVTVPAVSPRR